MINDIPQRYNVVYFVCDTNFERSIKAAERNIRGSSYRLFVLSSKMYIPSDFQKFLNNNNNKERLIKIVKETLLSHNNISFIYLRTIWVTYRLRAYFRNFQNIYFARGSTCELLSRGHDDDTFTVNHEEADPKLICLLKHAIKHEENSKDATFIVQSASGDIDISVILLNAETNSNVFIDNSRENNRRVLSINAGTQKTGQKKAIVGLQAFTGTDQNSSFFRSNTRCWKIGQDYLSTFSNFGKEFEM